MKVLYSNSFSPYLNLAYENYLLDHVGKTSILFIYQNSPSIIYGRFQNPWLECNVEKMLKDKILFVRRQSGGGCVYHDKGNLNFSFINLKENYDKDKNAQFLIDLLDSVPGIYANERHDLRIKLNESDFKISGSAFKEKKDRAFHHCTLLLNSDLDKLNYYLKSSLPSIESNSSKSIRSEVINISQYIGLDDIKHKLAQSHALSELSEKEMLNKLRDDKFYTKMKAHDWIFDETPLFSYSSRFFEIKIKKGKVIAFNLAEDFHPSLQSEINSLLQGEGVVTHIKDLYSFLDTNHSFSFYEKEKPDVLKELRNFVQVYFFQI